MISFIYPFQVESYIVTIHVSSTCVCLIWRSEDLIGGISRTPLYIFAVEYLIGRICHGQVSSRDIFAIYSDESRHVSEVVYDMSK